MIWDWWVAIGLVAQAAFSMRFLIQWIATERRKQSYVPISFWHFSIIGGTLLLIYAIHRRDPVFILGQVTGVFIYSRNLYFIYKSKTRRA
ncbi:MAG: lipid-A-disaccharide synthase N-terminal domain-containing protein [Candidatus Glassbacteria bacterium]